MTGRPGPGEVAPYFTRYIDALPEADLGDALRAAPLADAVRALDPALGGHRYAPDRWTVAGVVQHVLDTERIFAMRALCIARGDVTPLPGFDENAYAETTTDRPLGDLADEVARVRATTVDLFGSLSDDALLRIGTASGRPLSARAAGWVIAGHEWHHLRVLRERYLG